jgi:hypothetical protein
MRPECPDANRTRGRRAPSRRHERLARAPLRRTRWHDSNAAVEGGDKVSMVTTRPLFLARLVRFRTEFRLAKLFKRALSDVQDGGATEATRWARSGIPRHTTR